MTRSARLRSIVSVARVSAGPLSLRCTRDSTSRSLSTPITSAPFASRTSVRPSPSAPSPTTPITSGMSVPFSETEFFVEHGEHLVVGSRLEVLLLAGVLGPLRAQDVEPARDLLVQRLVHAGFGECLLERVEVGEHARQP